MFEKQNEPLASVDVFRRRIVVSLLVALGITIAWLIVGGIGFRYTAGLSWVDSLYNSAMMVSTMGPVFTFTTTGSKFFASIYALLSGLVFLATLGIVSAPILHRVFHKFHLDDDS